MKGRLPLLDEILLKFQEATKEGKPEQSVEDKMRGIKTEGKEIPLLQMQWQKESIPIRPHWGQKASREVGPKQTLTNGNCKAKEDDELPPPRHNEGNP